jgi:hypothetical protein
MDRNHAVELLKQFILEHGLPRTDMALFGVLCPYCGKSDRIRGLEAPPRLNGTIDQEAITRYARVWSVLAAADELLGICKFCQNVLLLDGSRRAIPLYQ